jgi:hypothetical protein
MGTVTQLRGKRGNHKLGPGTRYVRCAHCNERHPFIRLAGGTVRCLTAFTDGAYWFCRERGCYSGWMSAH